MVYLFLISVAFLAEFLASKTYDPAARRDLRNNAVSTVTIAVILMFISLLLHL